ncbi:subtilisin family serine protease [Kineococcus radiotolerans]|uniref:Subtilisin family serine protease n=1 Tax=Kineococcus radiotolerans TaxID=131568 RepID=A0A7W4TL88_KINRA|nr:S8 family serine peptidase [Kineococcus radiotolerans]MBB2900983.1 subtilisin family serine protease [Kineococcus radiotolerans]
MPRPARPVAVSLALLALVLGPGSAARAVEAPPADGTGVVVDALRWVDGEPQLETRTATDARSAGRVVRELEADPDVTSAQVRTTYRLDPVGAGTLPERTLLASDPYLSYAYHLDSVHAYPAWSTTRGAGLTVAVLDSGVDATQPDLTGRVRDGGNFAEGTDIGEHGTEVATVVAGAYRNAHGAAGVAPEVEILAVRVCTPLGCPSNAVVEGIAAAVDAGADVLNLSLGGETYNRTTAAAVAYAIGKGVVVVASAGNSGDQGNPLEYPASYPGVVSVSASARDGSAAPWAQHNDLVDLSAPGEAIPAGEPGSAGRYPYVPVSGTSFSAPQVAAAAALVRAVAPRATVAEVEGVLRSTTTPQSWGPGYGTGMLDVAAAVAKARTTAAATAPAPTTTPAPAPAPTTTTPAPAVTVTRGARSARPVPVVRP